MRLRTILLVLTILALLSITVSGFYYVFSLRESELEVARRRASLHSEIIRNQLEGFLSENLKPVRALAGLPEIQRALTIPDQETIAQANYILDLFRDALDVDVVYLLDRHGTTVASSNRNGPDSFVGENFGFRPYFREAMQGVPAKYLALGLTSRKRGAYYSHPVYAEDVDDAQGVVVIKAPISVMERNIIQSSSDGITLLAGPYGVIFSSNRPGWLFGSLWPLSSQQVDELHQSRQFGDGPWLWVGLARMDQNRVEDAEGRNYLLHARELESYPGWQVIHLQDLQIAGENVFEPLIKTTGSLVVALCLLAGLAVYYLYRKAGQEIERRRSAENELRESEERYRTLYHNTPAMLHSIDREGRLVSVSDYWCEALGYRAEEVIGRQLVEFLTAESRRELVERNRPLFLRTGRLKEVSYRFLKKSGEVIDVLLSAIAERDVQGGIVRSLAVLVDITERKRMEEELRQAQEQLSLYSKELERQVAERTREVTSFLAYTPAVVYLKDNEGRYLLVNGRFADLLGRDQDQVRGRRDTEVFSLQVAEQFRRNEGLVLTSGQPQQFEEIIDQPDGPHTYLSVKFPVQGEDGRVTALWSVSLDITELKKAQESLRRLSGMILASQEKERTSIARELHDELGQVLTALRMDAVWLQRRLNGDDKKAAERAQAMCELIDRTITEVRSIATRLRPAVLDDLGLVDALEWHTSDFEKRTGVPCRLALGVADQIKGVSAIAAYRVAQEALTNVARHAEASRVEVSLSSDDGWLVLRVSDDGRGFDPDGHPGQDGWGVAGMRERAGLVGGHLSILSAPNAGTTVELRLPLGGEARGEA
ncbi:MAG: PAS domain S-box protein [Thermodesulfobacteriota bacterium]